MPRSAAPQWRVRLTSALAFLVLASCLLCPEPWAPSPARAQQADQARKPAAKSAVEQAGELLAAGQTDAAIAQLKSFLAASPRSEQVDDAYLLLGAALTERKDYADAVSYLKLLLSEYPSSELAIQARVQLGVALAGMEQYEEALAVLAEARAAETEPAL